MPVWSFGDTSKKGNIIIEKLPLHTKLTVTLKVGLYYNCYKNFKLWSSLPCICIVDQLIKLIRQVCYFFCLLRILLKFDCINHLKPTGYVVHQQV